MRSANTLQTRFNYDGILPGRAPFVCWVLLLVGSFSALLPAQDTTPEWKRRLEEQLRSQNLAAAQQTVDSRLAETPSDLEARGWRARLLAWTGKWREAEGEYRYVLQRVPNDVEVLLGLADVLLWQAKYADALRVLDQAIALQPNGTDILLRRARVLASSGRTREARAQFRNVLSLDPSNKEARSHLSDLAETTTHELRFGADIDTFNFADPAQIYAISVQSRWSSRWSTFLGTAFYERFGESASKFAASTSYRFKAKDWLSVGGAVAHDRGVIPRNEAFFEYGHGFKFEAPVVRGLDASYQQRWLWYRDARVLTLNTTQLVYFPRDWTWGFSLTGARSQFSMAGSAWRPSGMTRLSFPVLRRFTGNTFFAVGSENFAFADQIGSFSARTFGGGIRFRITGKHDVSGYIARQNRSSDRTQTSFGVNYGLRF